MEMSPEEKANQKIWWILQSLKEEFTLAGKGNHIDRASWVSNFREIHNIPASQIGDVLMTMQIDWRILDPLYVSMKDEGFKDIDSIRGIYPLFDQVYEKYQALNKAITPKIASGGKLLFQSKCDTVTFIDKNGESQSADFSKNTSEYRILSHLAKNKGEAFNTPALIDLLKDPRELAVEASESQRVIDKIKAIRKKLGKDAVKTVSGGYSIECEVVIT